MNNEEKKEKMEFLQRFFAKSFLVSFVILLIASLLCILMHDAQMAMVNKYFPIEAEDFNYLVMLTMGIWKILIIQFTLVPALVIWCMRHCCKCNCGK
ncbi:MAG: DUF6868 family protein [Candidatus Gastranaerophilaceae bacterium]